MARRVALETDAAMKDRPQKFSTSSLLWQDRQDASMLILRFADDSFHQEKEEE